MIFRLRLPEPVEKTVQFACTVFFCSVPIKGHLGRPIIWGIIGVLGKSEFPGLKSVNLKFFRKEE